MATSAQEKIEKMQEDHGAPTTPTYRKKERKTYLLQTSGDVSFCLGDVALEKENSEGEFEDPEPRLYAIVDGVMGTFKNEKGEVISYQRQIPLDGTIESIEKMIKFWNNALRFVKETGIQIPVRDPEKDDIESAIQKYAKR